MLFRRVQFDSSCCAYAHVLLYKHHTVHSHILRYTSELGYHCGGFLVTYDFVTVEAEEVALSNQTLSAVVYGQTILDKGA